MSKIAEPEEARSKDADRPLILVVDDTAELRDILVRFLQRRGFEAVEATDGLAAKEYLAKERCPSLVLSDVKMPRCNGWQLLAHCHEVYPDLPVLIMSSEPTGEIPRGMELAAGFLPKPFKVAALFAELDRILASPEGSAARVS